MAHIMGLPLADENIDLPTVHIVQRSPSEPVRRTRNDLNDREDIEYILDHRAVSASRDRESGDVRVELGYGDRPTMGLVNMRFALLPIYQAALAHRGLPLHSALVECKGRGFLLVGPGNAGKSTCCQRLPKHWRALGDDEALVHWTADTGYRANPLPTWSEHRLEANGGLEWGRRWPVAEGVPLRAVLFLKQARHDAVAKVAHRARASGFTYEATIPIFNRFLTKMAPAQQREVRCRLMDNACQLVKAIPSYHLEVSLNGHFWKEIEQIDR